MVHTCWQVLHRSAVTPAFRRSSQTEASEHYCWNPRDTVSNSSPWLPCQKKPQPWGAHIAPRDDLKPQMYSTLPQVLMSPQLNEHFKQEGTRHYTPSNFQNLWLVCKIKKLIYAKNHSTFLQSCLKALIGWQLLKGQVWSYRMNQKFSSQVCRKDRWRDTTEPGSLYLSTCETEAGRSLNLRLVLDLDMILGLRKKQNKTETEKHNHIQCTQHHSL